MDDNKRFELNDEELENVVGGFEIGDHVVAHSYSLTYYCPGCGKLATYAYGTVIGKEWYEREQHYWLIVKYDCCGYIAKRADFACKIY